MATIRVIQIEVTTRCQLLCNFCPRNVLSGRWIQKDLSWETFSLIIRHLRGVDMVHLQGWGEPLLHQRIWDMARSIREKGCRVSLTTNGVSLHGDALERLCNVGVDLVAVSIAGAASRTHEALRKGSRLERILENISRVLARRPRPRVHLVMHMMRENMEELPDVVELSADLGVDKLIAPHLDYAPTAEVEQGQVFTGSDVSSMESIVEDARRRAERRGLELHIPPLSPTEPILMCDARPTETVWISVMGEVAPCPYLCLPVQGEIPRVYRGVREDLPRFSYGRVEDGLSRVLGGKRAREFMGAFERRLRWDRIRTIQRADLESMSRVSGGAMAFFSSLKELTARRISDDMPPAPRQCLNCPKLYGI